MIPRHATLAIGLLTCLSLAACGPESGPWVAFDGGGFVVNYSAGLSAAFYGFNVKPLRRLPDGMVLEAEFEDPAGGKPIIVQEEVKGPSLRYSFRTPYLDGIEAKHPYRGEIHILEPVTHTRLASYSMTFTSQVDAAWLKK